MAGDGRPLVHMQMCRKKGAAVGQMAREYEIGMLWVEGPLSYVEVLCAASFRDAGHHVKLYHYGPVENVPEGVECVDGRTILGTDRFVAHAKTGSMALFSDVFRYHLLAKNDRMIWADLDAYCARAFEPQAGYFYGWASKHLVNGGVLGLPQDSEGLAELIALTEDEYGIPEWVTGAERERLEALKDAGTPEHVSDMPWGVWGPHALTHVLRKTGEIDHALPISSLYPIGFRDRRKLLMARWRERVDQLIQPDTASVHFYGRRVREALASFGGLPEQGSYLAELLEKHRIDPDAAPVWRREDSEDPVPPKKKAGAMNLTDLADRYGSDKGSTKHRYTEVYHLLFNPFRQRKITFLEMGLLVGGPEVGEDADRKSESDRFIAK